ncbi:MAG: hypothetical protein SFZ03_03085, partial [Candidatus Melainabacteria bacterium]|nr:hypothetical protein [Candidatus Melainabacteria bacterium]
GLAYAGFRPDAATVEYHKLFSSLSSGETGNIGENNFTGARNGAFFIAHTFVPKTPQRRAVKKIKQVAGKTRAKPALHLSLLLTPSQNAGANEWVG